MSQIIKDRLINFAIHLPADINPYTATADYVAEYFQVGHPANYFLAELLRISITVPTGLTFLPLLPKPCPVPSWSRYVQRLLAVAFLL